MLFRSFGFRSVLLAFVFTMTTHHAFAGLIDNAFEAFEMKDYFKAKELFEKLERKDKLGGNYGLCLVHVTQKSPFYQLDSALVYAKRTQNYWRLSSDRDKQKVEEYGITAKSVEGLRVMVYVYATAEVKEKRTIPACESFIERFPSAPQKKEIIDLKATIAYELAKKEGTSDAIKKYLQEFSSAPEVVEAKVQYEKLLFEEQTADGSIESFRNFIRNYPNSPYRNEANDRVFEKAMENASVKSIHDFIKKNPESPYLDDAWRKLFRLFTPKLTSESLAAFKLEYPNYPFMAELDDELNILTMQLYPAEDNGKFGFVNRSGVVKIPF